MEQLKKFFQKIEDIIKIRLSHRPRLYALIVGFGIVLFWRGVWHTTDLIHTYLNLFKNKHTIDSLNSPWWDGVLSLLVGIFVLQITGAFTSSFIGNELILSGLRSERKLTKKTEATVRTEEQVILDIKQELENMTSKIGELEKEVYKKKHN